MLRFPRSNPISQRALLIAVASLACVLNWNNRITAATPSTSLSKAPTNSAANSATLPSAAAEQVDYARDVEPILSDRCYQCHANGDISGGLRLTRRANVLAGGDSGEPAVVVGHSEKSHMVNLVAGVEPGEVMPPQGKPLTPQQISLLRAWIDQGLKMPEDTSAGPPITTFWSFQPIQQVTPPKSDNPWAAAPIDSFIYDKLQANKLRPSPPADRVQLIRRLYLDVLGLPPGWEEVDRFVRSNDRNAYERLVDEVLASPRYGERWAQHWLDVVRFAESDGFERNQERLNSYHFRDYLIRAFNADRPFDQMLVEQLAGDAVGQDAGTAFLVGGSRDTVDSPDIVLKLTERQDELADMIGTTGTSMLGLTVGCARCHDHKFDPITQRDYYSLQAVFAGVHHGNRKLRHVDGAEIVPQTLSIADAKRPQIQAAMNEERFLPTPARSVRFTILATNDGLEPCIDELEIYEADNKEGPHAGASTVSSTGARNVALASAGAVAKSSGDYNGIKAHSLAHINDGRYGNGRSWLSKTPGGGWVQIDLPRDIVVDRIVWSRDRKKQFNDRLPSKYRIEVATERDKWRVVASSQDRRAPAPKLPSVYAGQFEQPEPTHVLRRGDAMQPGDTVAAEGLAVLCNRLGSLNMKVDSPEQQRRLALARWITNPKNPLTPRVAVNRLWHYHFGTGIVASPSDFGKMGIPPTHPELLDWLAGELVRNGWHFKPIHRAILLSNTYRQSNQPKPEALSVDASCRWLWRFPPHRLEAEPIRDSILQDSGVLDLTMYGPGFRGFLPNDNEVRVYTPKSEWSSIEWRRMVYMLKIRREQEGVFGVFDAPDAGQVCPKRSRSTTPLQAFNLLNSKFMVQQSELLASRVVKEAGTKTADEVRRAFLITLSRNPDAAEAKAGGALVEQHGLPSLCRALFNSSEFLFLP